MNRSLIPKGALKGRPNHEVNSDSARSWTEPPPVPEHSVNGYQELLQRNEAIVRKNALLKEEVRRLQRELHALKYNESKRALMSPEKVCDLVIETCRVLKSEQKAMDTALEKSYRTLQAYSKEVRANMQYVPNRESFGGRGRGGGEAAEGGGRRSASFLLPEEREVARRESLDRARNYFNAFSELSTILETSRRSASRASFPLLSSSIALLDNCPPPSSLYATGPGSGDIFTVQEDHEDPKPEMEREAETGPKPETPVEAHAAKAAVNLGATSSQGIESKVYDFVADDDQELEAEEAAKERFSGRVTRSRAVRMETVKRKVEKKAKAIIEETNGGDVEDGGDEVDASDGGDGEMEMKKKPPKKRGASKKLQNTRQRKVTKGPEIVKNSASISDPLAGGKKARTRK